VDTYSRAGIGCHTGQWRAGRQQDADNEQTDEHGAAVHHTLSQSKIHQKDAVVNKMGCSGSFLRGR
jgi:hypothetical protein